MVQPENEDERESSPITRINLTERENDAFIEEMRKGIEQLYDLARDKCELFYLIALNPGSRIILDEDWDASVGVEEGVDDYIAFLKAEAIRFAQSRKYRRDSIRILLAYYAQLTEASFAFRMPMRMLRILQEQKPDGDPFKRLPGSHQLTKDLPKSLNQAFKELVATSTLLGLHGLANTFKNVFNHDLRNSIAHSEYLIRDRGINLPRESALSFMRIELNEFALLQARALAFIDILRAETLRRNKYYQDERTFLYVYDDKEWEYKVSVDPRKQVLKITYRFIRDLTD